MPTSAPRSTSKPAAPAARDEDPAKFAARREALGREEQVRIAELRQKGTLKVHLRLINLLVIHQPKLLLTAAVSAPGGDGPLELAWDPLIDGLEAVPCPGCGHPTFAFEVDRQKRLVCPSCAAAPPAPARRLAADRLLAYHRRPGMAKGRGLRAEARRRCVTTDHDGRASSSWPAVF
jgi:hypothetical protein